MALTGKFEADFTDFYDAVQQATVELTSFEAGAKKVESQLQRMEDAFSGKKVIQDATLMAKAIEDIGGVSKLTEAELARVGRTANEAVEKMTALGMQVPDQLRDLADATKGAGTETQSLSVSVTDLVKSYVTAEAIIAAVKGAFDLLVGSISAVITSASEAEEADRALQAALEAQGTAMPSVLAAYEGYAAALQQTTRYSDDALIAAEALLAQVGGVMPRDMEKALLATTNLAAGLKKDLPEAAMMVAKAATGSTEALAKYGVRLDDTGGQAENFAAQLDKINARFSGAAAAAADTYAGRLDQLANTWDNVQESIGRAIVKNETVQTLLREVTGLIDAQTGELNENATVNNLVSDAVILVAKSLGLAAEGVDMFQKTLFDMQRVSNSTQKELLYLYGALLQIETITQTPLAWAGSEEAAARLREAGDNAKWAAGRIAELDKSSKDATATSAAWSAAIDTFQGKVTTTVAALEATRGQTTKLTAAQQEDAAAWQRTTENLKTAEEARQKALAEHKAEQDKLNAAMREYDSVGASYQDTLAGMNAEMVAGIAADLERGQSQSVLATVWGRTAAEIKAVAESMKAAEAAAKIYAQQQAVIARLESDLQRVRSATSRDAMQAQIDNAWAAAEAQKQALASTGKATEEAYALITQIAIESTDAIIQKTLEADQFSRAHYQKVADEAEVAYQRALMFSDQYTAERIIELEAISNKAQQDLATWTTTASEALSSTAEGAHQAASAIGQVDAAFAQAAASVSGFSQSLAGLRGSIGWDVEPGMAQALSGGSLEAMAAGRGTGGKRLAGHVSMATMEAQRAWDMHIAQRLQQMQQSGAFGDFSRGSPIYPGAGGNQVRVEPGAVTMNYPIMDDPRAKDELARIVGDSIMARMTRSGTV